MSDCASKLGFSTEKFYSAISKCLKLKHFIIFSEEKTPLIHLVKKKYFFFTIVGDGFRGTFIPYAKTFEAQASNFKLALPTFDHLEFRRFERDFSLEDFLLTNYSSFEVRNLETIILDLVNKDSGSILQNLPSKTRNMIRKAKKNELVTEIGAFKPNDANLFYTMLKSTYSRSNGRLYHQRKFFKRLSINFTPETLISIKVLHNNNIMAWGIFLRVNAIQYYLSGASTESGNRLGTNNFLQYVAIIDAIENNCEVYDMGGSGHKGIDRFKLSFGGKRVKTYRYIVRKRFGVLLAPILSRIGF